MALWWPLWSIFNEFFQRPAVVRNNWMIVFVVEVLREVCYQEGVHCLKEVRGKTWFSLNLFNTKMTPSLLVNKAITESLIGWLFTGCLRPAAVPHEAAAFRPPWSRAALQALWRLCSFPPSLCLFLTDPSLSPLFCLPVYLCFTHPILHALFYPWITSLALWLAYQNPYAFPLWFKGY